MRSTWTSGQLVGEPLCGAVRRAVVDDDQPRRDRLRGEVAQAAGGEVVVVEGDHDDIDREARGGEGWHRRAMLDGRLRAPATERRAATVFGAALATALRRLAQAAELRVRRLAGGDRVGVPMDRLPFAVLAAEHGRDAQRVGLGAASPIAASVCSTAAMYPRSPETPAASTSSSNDSQPVNREATQSKVDATSRHPVLIWSAPNSVTGSSRDQSAMRGPASPSCRAVSAAVRGGRTDAKNSSTSAIASPVGRIIPEAAASKQVVAASWVHARG